MNASMELKSELKSPVILDASEPDKSTCHPAERALRRYVSNEMGAGERK